MKKTETYYGNKELLRDIWSFARAYKSKFWIGTFFRATGDLVFLFPVWALSEIITFVANYETGQATDYVWWLLGSIAVASLYHFIAKDLAKYFLYQVAENSAIDAKKQTIRHLYSVDMAWHETENSGNKMQRMTKGGESIDKLLRLYVDLVIESTINLIAILIILTTLRWEFAFILLFFFFTYYFLSYALTKKAVHASHLVNLEEEQYSGMAFESMNNIAVVKSLPIADRIFSFLRQITSRLVKKIQKRILYYRIRSVSLGLYQEVFRLGTVAFTLWHIFQGNLEIGVLAMVLLYFGKIEESAHEFAETYSEFVRAKIAMLRMKQLLRIEPVIESSGHLAFPKDWKQLEMKSLSFAYHGQQVLKNFSLTIRRGEKVGIVGISGTGKSTLFKLLLKLYESYEGGIMYDQKNLKDITRSSYLQHLTIVPQETELFHLSLAENITLSQEKINTKLLQKAMDIAHVQDFLHKLPEGEQSLVGEKGIKLSGGERQRVGIARAIYQQPEILLLDEATSHLDVESEKKIQEALHTFFADITAIVIAHRLSTIREMDRIVVMDRGQVLEQGSFDELLAKKGAFAKLWKRQQF